MPIDRAVTLRNAEKLIRQGKLDAAIAEFVRLVEDQPRDWNGKNSLADLYARAGKIERRRIALNPIPRANVDLSIR